MLLRRRQSFRREPQQKRSSFTCDAILDAAQELLLGGETRHFHMAALARRAGVSSGTLYQYFPDWPAVMSAVLERAWVRAANEFRERFMALRALELPELLEASSDLVAQVAYRLQPLRVAVHRERRRRLAHEGDADGSEEWVLFFMDALRSHLPGDEERLREIGRSMVWAADGIVEGATRRSETSLAELRASLLAAWRGVVKR
jgi:AcrR family transcriptional regulator